MTTSVVLRLVDASVRAGEVAGELEVVATGRRRLFRSGDDLVNALMELVADRETA